MGGGDGCSYVVVDIILGLVMVARKSLRIFLTLIIVGIALPDCLEY